MVEELLARLVVEAAVFLAGAALAQLLRWLAGRLGLVGIDIGDVPSQLVAALARAV